MENQSNKRCGRCRVTRPIKLFYNAAGTTEFKRCEKCRKNARAVPTEQRKRRPANQQPIPSEEFFCNPLLLAVPMNRLGETYASN